MSQALLKISGLSSRYGEIVALHGVALEVHEGELVAVIGANGAGKTTLLKSSLGLVERKADEMAFEGRDLRRLSPLEIVRLGIGLVPEGRQVFGAMTVEENLLMGAYRDKERGAAERRRERSAFVYGLFPVLEQRAEQPAETLSGGEQQMLAVGRALMGRPRMLLVDELSLGLAPIVVHELYRQLMKLHREGMTIVIVEQNARLALHASDRAYVLGTGSVVVQGASSELMNDETVRKAYLG
jgi:branched-chain amino acid transport system ATP-binding protein